MQKENRKDVIKQRTTLVIPRDPLSGICSCRCETADPRVLRTAKSGERNRLGFTLIELLVVVLIIGILAAVALPQYKLAVAKARMTQLITLANSVVQAQERYYLANGEYTNDFTELDTDFDGTLSENNSKMVQPNKWSIRLYKYNGTQDNSIYVSAPNVEVWFSFVYTHSRILSSQERACYADKNNSFANTLCKQVTHKNTYTRMSDSNKVYTF